MARRTRARAAMTVLSARWRPRFYITVTGVTGPQVNIVKTVSDPQLKPLENGHKLRKVPRAMRNFSYQEQRFLLIEIIRPALN